MQFIFLNTKQFEMERQRTLSRFGLMHMVATNLCEWLYVIIEETKHEIFYLEQHHSAHCKCKHSFKYVKSVLKERAPVN